MVLISFSVPQLWPILWNGQKTRTMRALIYEGHINSKWDEIYRLYTKCPKGHYYLDLWWNARSNNPDRRHHLYTVQLKSIELRTLGSLTLEECKLDGFDSKENCLEWFENTYQIKKDPESFKVYIIQWTGPTCDRCRFVETCTKKERTDPAYFIIQPDLNICPAFVVKSRRTLNTTPLFQNLTILRHLTH